MKPKKLIYWILLPLLFIVTVYYFHPEQELPLGTKIDRLVVFKSKHELLAYSKGKLMKTYRVSLGKNPIGHKEYEGDKRTPEGVYTINAKNPNSDYYKNLGISYPNEKDVKHAKQLQKPTGGDVKIHGLNPDRKLLGKLHRWMDWTAGCIAVTNEEMEELYNSVNVGTPIEINP